MVFAGRSQELHTLEEAYKAPGFQMTVVYGRRRVGKTSLLRKFTEGKTPAFFFSAQQTSAQENLRLLSRCLLSGSSEASSPNALLAAEEASATDTPTPTFSSFEEAFRFVFSKSRDTRCVFVIDEYPYLAKSDPSVSSLLQTLIDKNLGHSNLHLVLCGSSMSFMEHQVLGEKSPLYGRRTGQIHVKPFDAFDARRLIEAESPVKAVELYSLVGGVPLYLNQLDARKSTEANIAENILRLGSFLYAEPSSYLLQEVNSPALYNAIIGAIAEGRTRPTDIADSISQATSAANRYLDNLIEFQIVRRDTPVAKATKKQVAYRISDNLFRFWYTFAPRYAAAIEAGMHKNVARAIAETESLSTFVGASFEEICRQWLTRHMADGSIDFLPRAVGSWWGTDPATRASEEIDVVAQAASGSVITAECKWRNRKTGSDVVERLGARSALLGCPVDAMFVFSKSGFTKECARAACRRGNVELVTVNDMFK